MKKTIIIISTILGVTLLGVVGYSFSNSSNNSTQGLDNLGSSTKATREITHFNLHIVPDLSNRIDFELKPKPVTDQNIIEVIIDKINPNLINSNGRRMHQKDKIQISFTNQQLISNFNINTEALEINLDQFKKQRPRIEYIKGSGNNGSLNDDIRQMKSEVKSLYKKVSENVSGADVWSYFNNLSEAQIERKGSLKASTGPNGEQFPNTYENVIILLTDGYIEAAKYPKDKVCNSLSEGRVRKFREAYIHKGNGRTVEQFFKEEGYGILPIDNPLLAETKVLVLELDDRSLDQDGNARVQPTDGKIIEMFWTDWLEKSGIKEFELHSKANSRAEVNKSVDSFLNL